MVLSLDSPFRLCVVPEEAVEAVGAVEAVEAVEAVDGEVSDA